MAQQRDSKGRFGAGGGGTVRPGAGSGAGGEDPAARALKIVRVAVGGAGSEGPLVIVSASTPENIAGGGVSFEAGQLAVDVDARGLVDAIGTALLLDHRQTVMDGLRPDKGGAQKPIGPRARRRAGRLSDRRGVATGELADGLRRTKITGDAGAASTFVAVPPSRNAFAGQEAARGIRYLSTGGRKADVIRRAVAGWLAACTRGVRQRQDAERRARETAGA